ncbi:glycine--tRNA ligase subunit beta [uncultured Murdochiella sp.]|uniref:glycine--tRNA ligase subunit beta n=1 Tax=uncultured Murdochiella sp. TaxID=1586095 RepID=UPI0028045C5F|nr:glycine--tRNA ligase subunit beta [uncultured Murdochiella sp.]
MTTYLLELGVEEFPSRYMASTKQQLKQNVLDGLASAGLSFSDARVEATPRRFALWLEEVKAKESEGEEVVRGPSKQAAFDAEGQPTKALLGFLRAKGLQLEDTFVEDNGKNEYVFARLKKEAVSVEKTLPTVIAEAVRKISNPRAMRWGGKNLRFLRPIRWMVSLLDDQVLPIDLEGIPVGNRTNGHRFLGEKNFVIHDVHSYETQLEENYVIIDESKRRDRILRGLNRLAREKGGVPMQNEELLEEVVNIVEYPTVFLGDVPREYLTLPPEVIITPMMDHQRYFPVVDDDGHLLPYFLSVRNGNDQGLQNVIDGNRKVLIPRLEDAKFFYQQDQAHSLEDLVPKLDELVFHEKLGTMREKTARLESLGVSLAKLLGCGPSIQQNISRAAHLCKADLVTKMVVEFTELQGTMGRIYAAENGEVDAVSHAIEEHYLPRQSGGDLPKTTAGMVLSLADKLDTLAGLFAIDINVTGSQDPFGLRRAVIGMLDILQKNLLHIELKEALRDALLLYVEQKGLVFDYNDVIARISDFFRGRLRTKLQEQGIRYDVADAVLATEDDDYLRLMQKAAIAQKVIEKDTENELITGFVRIESMAEHAESTAVDANVLQDEDQTMFASLSRADAVREALQKDHYEEAFALLADWMPILHDYLDRTMILVDDASLKEARLGMLAQVNALIEELLIPHRIVRES